MTKPDSAAIWLGRELERASSSDGYGDMLGLFVERMARVGQLECAARARELESIFADAARSMGFVYFTYHVVRSNGLDDVAGRLPYMISTYPAAWLRHYFAAGYLDDDPLVGELLRNRLPFLWSEAVRPEDLSSRQRQLLAEARAAGVANGITLPIHGRDGEIAALSLVPAAPEPEASMVMRNHQHVLYLMALHYHTEARRVLLKLSLTGPSSRRQTVLSPREREVLEWTAKGKYTAEISSILAISSKSVEFHIEGAKRKLHVFNRTHAVAKAITLGLLSLR